VVFVKRLCSGSLLIAMAAGVLGVWSGPASPGQSPAMPRRRTGGGAAVPDLLAIRKSIAPRVCLVRADGALGVPEAYASGFLLGAGKFVITDLASVARPGVQKVTIRFNDGTSVASDRFGMADAATGLVAIALPQAKKDPGGLSLSTAGGAAEGGIPVVVVGGRHAEELDLAAGRMAGNVPASELAEACGGKAPAGAPAFLRLYAPAKAGAAGAPAVDADGGVVGTMMAVAGADGLLAVPAGALRRALLAAEPALEPLSRLPKPVWPVAVQTLPGEPMSPQEFAGAVRAVKLRSRCDKCGGDGQIVVKKVVGHREVAGINRTIVKQVPKRCPACGGDGIICKADLYDYFARVAEGATRLAADPATKPSVMEAVVENTGTLLHLLLKTGDTFRRRLAEVAAKDLEKEKAPFPRGVVVYAQRLETVRHGGRAYMCLRPYRSNVRLAVPTANLERALGAEPAKARSPGIGDWIVLAGLVRASVKLNHCRAVYVKAFGWIKGPDLGPLPSSSEKADSEKERPRRRHHKRPSSGRNDGRPDFFGVE